MRRTKIICTIGPASSKAEVIEKLVQSGMDVARINFSHGTLEDHRAAIETVKTVRKKLGKSIGILQDLSGPKIRVGDLPDGEILLEKGRPLRLIPGGSFSKRDGVPSIPVSYSGLLDDFGEGARILLDDGRLELAVEKKLVDGLRCRIIRGGLLKSHKGVNFPGQKLSQAAPTEKDLDDLRFGITNGVDYVALSFVQSAEDVVRLKEEIKILGGSQLAVAKLERESAVHDLDAILMVADAVMVARGDLGIEADISMVPIYQKQIVESCIASGTPVIIATQMLEGMMEEPLPTRAEANDVATGIFSGSDAIMLSGETAVGKYPIQAVSMMRRIADNAERSMGKQRRRRKERSEDLRDDRESALAGSVCRAAEALAARAIIAQTLSGSTARLIAKYRPAVPIIATTPEERTYYQLSLVWGVEPVLSPHMEDDFIETVRKNDSLLQRSGILSAGDLTIISAGIPPGQSGGTNLMKVHLVGQRY